MPEASSLDQAKAIVDDLSPGSDHEPRTHRNVSIRCPSCDAVQHSVYRCTECFADLLGDGSGEGR